MFSLHTFIIKLPCSLLWTVPIYMPYPCVYVVVVHFRRWTSWHPTRRTTQNNSGIESLFQKGFISLEVHSIFVQAIPLLTNTKDHCYLVYHCKCLLRSTTTNYESTGYYLQLMISDNPWRRPIHYTNTIPDSIHSLRFTWYTQCFNTWLYSCLRIIVIILTDLLWVIPEHYVYEVHLKIQSMSNRETIIHCTLQYSCMDYWVCGLSMHDYLVANN